MLNRLKASGSITKLAHGAQASEGEEFDLLIIGGGATGAGCAVDAASRGLKVALLERDDFSAGVSFILFMPLDFHDQLRRYIVQVDKTCTRRCSLPPEGCYGTRLRPIQARQGSPARAADLPPNCSLPLPNVTHHASDI